MPQITATSTPQDVYTLASITSDSPVQLQNKSGRPLMLFAGDAAPGSLDDYFVVDSWVWEQYQGVVIMIWADADTDVMVQNVS